MGPNPKVLKHSIQQKVKDCYLEIIWYPICMAIQHGSSNGHSCVSQFRIVKSLALGQDVPFDDAELMLGRLAAFDRFADKVSRAERIFRTAIDWRASEATIDRLLDRLPEDCVLDQKAIMPLLRLSRYSSAFWKKLGGRRGEISTEMRRTLEVLRYRLTAELGLFGRKEPSNTKQ